uniref:Uncharacterized protein n=1 Tax=Prorocentrum micans TaxID=2945 RepID=A0A7S2X6P1_PROMC|mmetsp:Transcript_5960/g.4703  ORF Transcript_5960/g.4703 Transcript_5960/m.4703 type:complete len:129 (+) Transcript_5960:152-538(+)
MPPMCTYHASPLRISEHSSPPFEMPLGWSVTMHELPEPQDCDRSVHSMVSSASSGSEAHDDTVMPLRSGVRSHFGSSDFYASLEAWLRAAGRAHTPEEPCHPCARTTRRRYGFRSIPARPLKCRWDGA